MGAAFTAIGCLASALTSSQIIAGHPHHRPAGDPVFPRLRDRDLGRVVPRGAQLFHYISCQQHLHYFASGLLDTRPVGLFPERRRVRACSSPIRSWTTAAGAAEIMSEDSERPSEKPAKPIHRFGTGALSLLQIACFTLVFLAVNYLGSLHYVTKDLSAEPPTRSRPPPAATWNPPRSRPGGSGATAGRLPADRPVLRKSPRAGRGIRAALQRQDPAGIGRSGAHARPHPAGR